MESKYLLNFILHFHDLNFYCMKFSIKVKYHAWMSVLLKEMATATSLKDKGKLKKKKKNSKKGHLFVSHAMIMNYRLVWKHNPGTMSV